MSRLTGWVATLAVLVVLTLAATVTYVLAPFDPPPAERVDTGRPGTVDPRQRILAVRADGGVVLLDAADGSLSEVVHPGPRAGIRSLDVGSDREVAYIAGAGDRAAIRAVRLGTGSAERRAAGHAVAVGPIAFPQLPRTVPRPDVERLAYVVPGRGGDEIVIENLTTGDRRRLGPSPSGERPFGAVDDLVLSPVGNRLFGVADRGATVFRIDLDRMSHLSQAVAVPAPDGGRILDAAPFGDGLVAVVRRRGEGTALVELERRALRPRSVLAEGTAILDVEHVDSDARASSLLLVTGHGRLLVLEPGRRRPRPLADGVSRAAW